MPLPTEEKSYERTSAKQMVYDKMKDWIIEGRLEAGEKVADAEIAAHFKVSRTPVREAIQLLEMQKLVRSYPGKATIVTEIQKDQIEKYYLPMANLQQLAVTMAVDKINPEHIKRLRELSEQFRRLITVQDEPLPILKADMDFHSYILDIADNEYVKDFCNVLWIHIQRLEYSYFRDSPSLKQSVEEHEDMIRALEFKDGFSASLRMKQHWDRTVLEIHSLEAREGMENQEA